MGDELAVAVFHRRDHPVKWFQDAWRAACRAASVEGRLFHDLRRPAVRNMVAAGAPESAAMKVTSHKDRGIFERYNITTAKEAAAALELRQTYEAALSAQVTARAAGGKTDTETDMTPRVALK